MGTILLKNIALDGSPKDIIIKDGIIASICAPEGAGVCTTPGAEVVDCSGKSAFPGFVNMHTHAGMALMRGVRPLSTSGKAALYAPYPHPLGPWLPRVWV